MSDAISTLSSTVNATALWGIFGETVPFLAVMVLFAFGMYEIRKMIRGASKGKANS